MSEIETGRSPVLFCFDGSEGSREALRAAADLLVPSAAVVLTVWETVVRRLVASGLNTGLGGTYIPDEADLDAREEATARDAAEQGVQAGSARGWSATARVELAEVAVSRTIVDVADEVDAALIVCGARGLNTIKRTILGSVSEAVLHGSHRPTLIWPQTRRGATTDSG
jgi:nucleotide-binding universal stress UspA family protein